MAEFRILGALEVATEDGLAALGGAKQRGLLAILLLQPNVVVSRNRLIDLLWGEQPPETAVSALQVHVHGLRKALGQDRLRTSGPGYVLSVKPGELDLERFMELCDEGRDQLAAGDSVAAATTLGDALALWRGPALDDLASESFAEAQAARLEELRLAALEDRIEADLRLGRNADLVAELTSIVAEHRYRERLHRHLMLALYGSGRQAEALDAYQRARLVLAEDLGIDPGDGLQELQGAILRHDPSLHIEPYELRVRRHLPAPVTELIGREGELDRILALLHAASVRLLTLTGPGGTGKTRLGLRAAFEAAHAFPDGVFFVGLAPVRDPDLIASVIAHALGIEERTDEPVSETLKQRLADQKLLLLLDNFEHVDAAAPLVGELLASGPGLKALVTSRTPLRIYGEHLFAVPVMDLEDEAIPLFVSRARAVAPATDFRPENVAEVCTALDNLPLAIELAAARASELSLTRMAQLLSRRLELATGGARDVPVRQRTLRETIDWSYDLLDETKRRVFRRIAVFAGGFSSEAAEAVCGADAADLQWLVEKNIVNSSPKEDQTRFTVLETIREFAFEQLQAGGELDDIKERHALYYARLARQGEGASRVRGAEQTSVIRRLETEMDNIRVALDWSFEEGGGDEDSGRRRETAVRIAGSLAWVWWSQGHAREGRRWVDLALERSEAFPSESRARCLHAVGVLADLSGDLERASRCLREAVAAFDAMGDKRSMSSAMNSLAIITRSRGDLAEARELLERSLSMRHELGDERGTVICLSNLGVFALDEGDLDRAQSLMEEARTLSRDHDDAWAEASDIANLGAVALERGDVEKAGTLLRQALIVLHEAGDSEAVAETLGRLAGVAAARGEAESAARLSGASDALMREIGAGLADYDRKRVERHLARARSALGAQKYKSLEKLGARMTLDDVMDYGLAAFRR